MPNNELEKGLRERLYDLEEAVNTDATWLAVQAGLDPPKKKRRGIIWWWLSGGFMLLALGGWLLWPPADAELPGLVAGQELEVNTTNDAQDVSEYSPAASELIANESEAVTNGSLATAPDQTEESRPTSETRRNLAALADDEPAGGTGNVPAANSSLALSSPAVEHRLRSDQPGRSPENAAPATLAAQQAKTEQVSKGGTDAAAIADTRDDVQTSNPSATTVTSQLNAAASVATLPIELLPVAPEDDAFSPLPGINESTIRYPFGKSGKPGWTLEARGGIAKPFKTVVAPLEDSTGRPARDFSNERLLEAVMVDALVGYHTASKWSIRSGVSYQRVNSVIEFSEDSTVDERREGITEVVINPTGDTTFLTGLVNASVRTTAYNRHYNQLTTIDVPLLVGKTFAKGKWRIGLEAGPVLNLFTSGSARYQEADGSFSTRAENDGLFRKQLYGISWRANLSAGLVILPGLEANVSINALRRYRSGFEVEGSATRTTYDLVGVQIGIRKSL